MTTSIIIAIIIALSSFFAIIQTLELAVNKRKFLFCLISSTLFLFFVERFLYGSVFYALNVAWPILFSIISVTLSVTKTKLKTIAYLSLLFLGLALAINMLPLLIIGTFTPITNIYIYYMSIMSMLFIAFIIAYRKGAIGRLFRSSIKIKTSQKAMLLITVWTSILLASLISFIYQQHPNLPGLALAGVLTAILIILLGIILPLLIVNSLSNDYYKNLSRLMDKQVQAQVEHYKSMSIINEDIKKFRHDYSNLRLGILSHLNNNNVQGAISYLEDDTMSLDKLRPNFETGNIVLDALLGEKQSIAAEVNADIEFDGSVPMDLINTADVCIIFGNALDNAIEAVAGLPGESKLGVRMRSLLSTQSCMSSIVLCPKMSG